MNLESVTAQMAPITLGLHCYNLISFSVAGRRGRIIKALAPINLPKLSLINQLVRQFGAIEVKESTLPNHGWGYLKPNMDDDDDIAARYEALPKHYSLLHDAYYVVLEP